MPLLAMDVSRREKQSRFDWTLESTNLPRRPQARDQGLTARQWTLLKKHIKRQQNGGRYRLGITGLWKAIRTSKAWYREPARFSPSRRQVQQACESFGIPYRGQKPSTPHAG